MNVSVTDRIMNLIKTPIIYILLVALGTMLSCDSENDSVSNFSDKLWDIDAPGVYSVQWSDLRDEIVVLTWTGVVVIDIETKAVRKLEFEVGRELPVSWLVGDTLYFVKSTAQLAAINVSTFAYTPIVADSVVLGTEVVAHTTHFAYAKRGNGLDPYNIFLYDIQAGTEIPIAVGLPLAFSPDGKQLLYSSHDTIYLYYLDTNTSIVAFEFRNQVCRWTTEGVFSIWSSPGQIHKRNETDDALIGSWDSYYGPTPASVSKDGQRIVTTTYLCQNQDPSNCTIGFNASIVNTENDTETILLNNISTFNHNIIALSPDGRRIAYLKDYALYITESAP